MYAQQLKRQIDEAAPARSFHVGNSKSAIDTSGICDAGHVKKVRKLCAVIGVVGNPDIFAAIWRGQHRKSS